MIRTWQKAECDKLGTRSTDFVLPPLLESREGNREGRPNRSRAVWVERNLRSQQQPSVGSLQVGQPPLRVSRSSPFLTLKGMGLKLVKSPATVKVVVTPRGLFIF